MSQKVEPLGGGMNTLKWIVALSLLGIGLVANYMFADLQPAYLRAIGLSIVAGLALIIMLRTRHGKVFWAFSVAAKNEMRKVVWPTRQETVQFTAMVLAMVMIMGLILWGIDILLLKLIALITGFGST